MQFYQYNHSCFKILWQTGKQTKQRYRLSSNLCLKLRNLKVIYSKLMSNNNYSLSELCVTIYNTLTYPSSKRSCLKMGSASTSLKNNMRLHRMWDWVFTYLNSYIHDSKVKLQIKNKNNSKSAMQLDMIWNKSLHCMVLRVGQILNNSEQDTLTPQNNWHKTC